MMSEAVPMTEQARQPKYLRRFLGQPPVSSARAWYLNWQGLLFSVGTVSLATFLCVYANLAAYNVNMIYILLTLAATVWFGLGAGLITAVVALLCFDFFFIVPYYSFLGQVQDALAIFVFLFTALFTNLLLGRAQLHNRQAQARSREVGALYELVTTAITNLENQELLTTALSKINQALDVEQSAMFLVDPAQPDVMEATCIQSGGTGAGLQVDWSQLAEVFQSNRAWFSEANPTLPLADSLAYLPLSSARQPLGVLVVSAKTLPGHLAFTPTEQKTLEVFANHLTLVIEHIRLIKENVQVAALRESDRLKSALLASVSHELRTPLTAIRTATDSLLNPRTQWNEAGRTQFLHLIAHEVDRLSRLVSNLLDLSKLEAGAFKPDFGWYYLPEIVQSVVARLQTAGITLSHRVETYFAPEIPLARMDYLQVDQVLTNLIENAAKYSPGDSAIKIAVEVQPPIADPVAEGVGQLQVSVVDQGIGVAASEQVRIFDKFYRGTNHLNSGKPAPGTGIGLTIAKGLIEAHGGSIWVESAGKDMSDNGPVNSGSKFYFTLPLIKLAPEYEAEA